MALVHFAKLLIHDLLYLIIQIYSHLFRLVFVGYNHYFKPRLVVPLIAVEKRSTLTLSAVAMAKMIREREISCVSLVSDCIGRAKQVNSHFNPIAEDRYEAALQVAKHVDQIVQDGSAPSVEEAPLLGVPCTIKECIFVEGMQCTGGMAVQKARRSEVNAQVVTRILQAGAIPIATTVTSEMCASFECNNPLYGRVRNPYDSRRTPGGSSGGEACAIASCCVPFGIGSDGGGSIRMPANFCGIFGHKPTQGTIPSHETCLPLCGPQLDLLTCGPMSRHAEDLRITLKVMMDPKDSLACKLNKKVDLQDVKVFFVDEIVSHFVTGIEHEVKQTMYQVVNHLELDLNLPCIRINPKLLDQSFLLWMNEMGHEGSRSVSQSLLNGRSTFISTIKVAGKSDHTPQAILFVLFEKLASIAEYFGLISSKQRQKGRDDLERLRRQITALLSIENAILLFPSHPTLAPFHNQSLIHPADHAYAAIFNALGLPVTQVPVRLTQSGIPVGVQVVAGKHNDYLTLSVAEAFEREFGGWREPVIGR